MDGRETDDDDTHERYTDTHRLTTETLSQLGCHTSRGSVRHYATRGNVPPRRPPSTQGAMGTNNSRNNTNRRQGTRRVRLEQAAPPLANSPAGEAQTRAHVHVGSSEVSMEAPSQASGGANR